MSLDILQLIIHYNFNIRRSRDVLAKERRVLLKGFGLNLANGLAAFRDVALEFMACLCVSVGSSAS